MATADGFFELGEDAGRRLPVLHPVGPFGDEVGLKMDDRQRDAAPAAFGLTALRPLKSSARSQQFSIVPAFSGIGPPNLSGCVP
jgi:hypothetical protein